MKNKECVVDGIVYTLVHKPVSAACDISEYCNGCAGEHELCSWLGDCNLRDNKNYIWVEATTVAPYETCMKEYNKYSQYDSVEMDEFERGCIMGRKLQSLKLAKMFEK